MTRLAHAVGRVARWLACRLLPEEPPRVDPEWAAQVEKADRPYDWPQWDDWSWAREHDAEIRAMWSESQPEHSVRECCLSDAERAAWAEIVASWRPS